jgi:hypothetical protein
MQAGQTFALAGLVQERSETVKRGLPYVSDLPVVGVPFRRTQDEINEIELLVLVTPEFVDAVDKCEMPCGGPGSFTTSPNDRGLYCGGHVEVPTYCNPTQGMAACGGDDSCSGGCGTGGCATGGCSGCNNHATMNGSSNRIMREPVVLPGGSGYDDSTGPTVESTITDQSERSRDSLPAPSNTPRPQGMPSLEPADEPHPAPGTVPPQQGGAQASPEDITLPIAGDEPGAGIPPAPTTPPVALPENSSFHQPTSPANPFTPVAGQVGAPVYTSPRPYSPQRQPVFQRNASRPHNPQSARPQAAATPGANGLIGPVGYDAQ